MTTRFESYGRTTLGRRLAEIGAAPERSPDYCAFSREGFPAITALVSLMRPELERLRHSNRGEFDAAKQFVAGSSDQLCEPAATSALAARGYRADCLLSGRSG